jgi:hypothetical protein
VGGTSWDQYRDRGETSVGEVVVGEDVSIWAPYLVEDRCGCTDVRLECR